MEKMFQPKFLNMRAVAKFFGLDVGKLSRLAKQHEIFAPDFRSAGKGTACFYHHLHLDYITSGLLGNMIWDDALKEWRIVRKNLGAGSTRAEKQKKQKSGAGGRTAA